MQPHLLLQSLPKNNIIINFQQILFSKKQKMQKNSSFSILLFPWLAHGHISPYLEPAKKLAAKSFTVYLCSTRATLSCIKKTIENSPLLIQTIELDLPTSKLDAEYHTTNGLPAHLMPCLKEAFKESSFEFSKILQEFKPDLVIYDFLQPWAPVAAEKLNIPAVEFITSSAAMTALSFHEIRRAGMEFPFPEIYYHAHEIAERQRGLELKSLEEIEEERKPFGECFERSNKIVLIKTFNAIESKYCDYLSEMFGKKVLPVGPLVQIPSSNESGESSEYLLSWLNTKSNGSTVFVAFGTEYFLKKDEIEEIAHGLELSNANFIWVLRFPKGCNIELEEVLPKGFFERVGDRGKVIQGWAPQARILNHAAIGGFVSHCGWSSVMESMKFGVPIIAMPMHLDQPINTRLVVEEVGAGLEVMRDKDGKIQRQEIAKVIDQVLDVESGRFVRENAMKLRREIQVNGERDVDRVVEELLKLCLRSKKKRTNGILDCFLHLKAYIASFFDVK